MELQELDTLDLNEALAEILQAHGYAKREATKSCPISPCPCSSKPGHFRANTPTAWW